MLRLKKIYTSLLSYVIIMYTLVVLIYKTVVPGELETILTFENYTWEKLSDEVFVLSAFLETRNVPNSPFVRIITISKFKEDQLIRRSAHERGDPKLYSSEAFNTKCEVYSETGSLVSKPDKHETIIFDEKGLVYAATFINCLLEGGAADHVSEVVVSQDGKSVKLPVHKTEKVPLSKRGRTNVCVRALFGPYNNINQMSQFISYYSTVLGVDKFTFYLLDVSDKIKYFLGELQQRDLEHGVTIEAVDYNLDKALMSWDAIWDYGALALLTDCVYQSMSEYDYTYIVDMDEFIVPHMDLNKPTSEAMVNLISQFKRPPRNKTSDSFLFKNSFFCGEHNNQTISDPFSDNNFDVFSTKFREDFIWSYKLRAKMLVKSSQVVSVGHHMIYDWVNPNTSYNCPVPEQVALLHHYRYCEGLHSGFAELGPPVLKNSGKTKDESIFKYEEAVKMSDIYKVMQTIL